MAVISLTSLVDAPLQRVFDLSRSIELHIISTGRTNEKAVEGVTGGLIGLGETVTWQAFHLFKQRRFTSKITAFDPPFYFRDEMQNGDFKKFEHDHFFKLVKGKTEMKDRVILESPFGLLGTIVTRLFLKRYITTLLLERCKIIRDYAETDKWKTILTDKNG
ncbi:MAG: SRPBCC family protein [Ferruginibacter sp.]|nr:SRPBCC family protein [Ferruginibacter sp.]